MFYLKKIPFCNIYSVWAEEGYIGQLDPDRGYVYLNYGDNELRERLEILYGLFKL